MAHGRADVEDAHPKDYPSIYSLKAGSRQAWPVFYLPANLFVCEFGVVRMEDRCEILAIFSSGATIKCYLSAKRITPVFMITSTCLTLNVT